MDKPFKGFIAQWSLVNDRIYGVELDTETGEFDSSIRTSEVLRIWPDENIRRAETKNSIYILI